MTPTIPLVDLKTQYRLIKDDLWARWTGILEQGVFILGDDVVTFEGEFARYCGVQHAIGVANGTDAITLALMAAGIRPGDEVVVPANSFIATAEGVVHAGAKPVFADIEPATYSLSIDDVRRRLTSRTRAIVPVHLYGQPADMAAVRDLAASRDLIVIEDAAQAHGATYEGSRVGSLGRAGCFSFYPGKNLGAYGDAGAVTTNDCDLAEHMRRLRDHGSLRKYEHDVVGFNSRLDSLQAAVLRIKLKRLDNWNATRREIASLYTRLLSDMRDVVTPISSPGAVHHLYVIRLERANRDKVRTSLDEAGIQTGIHYPTPLHLTRAFAYLGYRSGDFPNAERCAGQVLSLPMYPELAPEQIEQVVTQLRRALERA